MAQDSNSKLYRYSMLSLFLFLSALYAVPQLTEEPNSLENTSPGKSAEFAVKTIGNNLTYTWNRQPAKQLSPNDKREVVGNDATLHIDKVESSDEGYYVCTICNTSGGSVETKSVQLTTSTTYISAISCTKVYLAVVYKSQATKDYFILL